MDQKPVQKKTNKLKEALADMAVAEKEINQKAEVEKAAKKPVEIAQTEETTEVKVKVKSKQMSRMEEIAEKLADFVKSTNSYIKINPNTPSQKIHALAPAWAYLATLNDTHTEIVETYEEEHMFDRRIIVVHAVAQLVSNKTGKVMGTAKAVAETNEPFVRNLPLNATYGLAQTRAKSRAVQTVFGHYMTMIKLELTPAEEIFDERIDLEAI